MSSDAERTAFARACAYLNYKAAAKWTAYTAGVLVALLYVGLLVLLVLFADVVVHRGLLPESRDLSADGREHVLRTWGLQVWRDLPEKERAARLEKAGLTVQERPTPDGKKGQTQKRVVVPGAEEGREEALTDWGDDLAALGD